MPAILPAPPRRRIRVLVAEDDPAVARDYQRAFAPGPHEDDRLRRDLDALESTLFGSERPKSREQPLFETEVHRQGAHALDAHATALAAGERFDAALIDVRMPPGLNGVETAARLRAADPEILIGVVTGYSDLDFAEIAARIPPARRLFFLRKPFDRAEIRSAVTSGVARVADPEPA